MRDNIILPYRSPSDHLHDRVTCTHEVPPSSELQSINPVHVKQIQSSAALTVHLALSPTESGMATYESVSDCKNECEYDDIAETYRKSRPASEGYSDIHERAQENTLVVSGEKGKQQPTALCNKKEENKDHLYAVVYKERKGRASSEASALKKSSYHPQEEISGLPVNRRSCVDCIGCSSHPTESGLDNNTNAAESETPQTGGSIEYVYAAIDKTKKEKKQPQVIHFTNPEYTSFYLLIY